MYLLNTAVLLVELSDFVELATRRSLWFTSMSYNCQTYVSLKYPLPYAVVGPFTGIKETKLKFPGGCSSVETQSYIVSN